MVDRREPAVYSIAAHRGFADALVAGLVPRYSQDDLGLARLTLLVPSSRAARTISEAFVRHSGGSGLLMPRMVTVGDLDLDEALGSLLDPLGATDIPSAVQPTQRWLELADLIGVEYSEAGRTPLGGAARLRLARDFARTMDRLLVENVAPGDLLSDRVLDQLGNLSEHWRLSLRTFAAVQQRWLARLGELGRIDASTRRNLLFERAAKRWRDHPPETPIVAAGVTSAAPALAGMLRAIADLPNGAVILPNLDLGMSDEAWDELGQAGSSPSPAGATFGMDDALTHPQYHLKLLLERMGIARAEVRQWHRKGTSASPPQRSYAISSLFLPPKASQSWTDLPTDHRRLAGIRLMTSGTAEEEAQAIALLVRKKLEEPEQRVAVITADRSLARRVTQHLARWNIDANDTAGRKLSLTPAGRLFGLLAQLASEGLNPALLVGMLAHPLVASETADQRRGWLTALRKFEYHLRGSTPAPGFEPLRKIAARNEVGQWWQRVEDILGPLVEGSDALSLGSAIDRLVIAVEKFAGERVWMREDGRALSKMVDDLRFHAHAINTGIVLPDLAPILRDCMEEIAVRPPYGGHPRVSIYGLLESRMARADLVICGGLNEGSWPQSPNPDPLLPPGILRALGVPGAEFSIGLAAHDLASAMGAPQVVLSRSQRDAEGPALTSRFWLRVEALLGEDLAASHRETSIPAMLPLLDREPDTDLPTYPRPRPNPSSKQRRIKISATALDRLLGDPYQFYAREILGLKTLEALAADPFSDPALRGTLVHEILDRWHKSGFDLPGPPIARFTDEILREKQVHPLFWGLWRPRIAAALENFQRWIAKDASEGRQVLASELWGEMEYEGVRIIGKPDRVDRMPDGTLAIVDYKTGNPPSPTQVQAGYALQLGVLGLIARDGQFKSEDGSVISGHVTSFEYWSLARAQEDGFGYRDTPIKVGNKRTGLLPAEFMPHHEAKLKKAIALYIKGDAPFVARENPDYPSYTDYDQLMRLEEWQVALADFSETTDE